MAGTGNGWGRTRRRVVLAVLVALVASVAADGVSSALAATPSPVVTAPALRAASASLVSAVEAATGDPGDVSPGDLAPPGGPAGASPEAAGGSVTAAVTVAGPPSDEGRRIVLAAPWPLSKAQTDFYKMVILPDGYPAALFKGKLLPHPIYGTYLVQAFLAAYQRTHDVRSKRALIVVARAAVRRMRPFHGGLVFWYDPGKTWVMTGSSGRAYSALTQAYYMDRVYQAGVAVGLKDLRVAARLAFKSLLVPTSVGGVMSSGAVGPVLEEMPQAVPSAILNGWLSALASLQSYAARSHFADARALLTASSREVARRLGRYDLPGVLGTAYSGYGRLALRLDVPVGTAVTRGALVVDRRAVPLLLGVGGQRSDVVRILGCGSRRSGAIVATCSHLRIDVPVTSGGIAGTDTLRLTLRAPGRGHVRVTLYRGVYSFVHLRGRAVVGWTGRRTVSSTVGATTVALGLSASVIKAALTPTTFKRYGGHYVNTYHQIHINRLTALAAVGGAPFRTYAQRWRAYTCHWAGHPAYRLVPRSDLGCA